jgi:hypothetical protein
MKRGLPVAIACLAVAACQPPLPGPVQTAGTRWNASASGTGARLEAQGRRGGRWVARTLVLGCDAPTPTGSIQVQTAEAADGGRARISVGSDVRLEIEDAGGIADSSDSPLVAALRAGRRPRVDGGRGAITLAPPSAEQLDWLDRRCRGGR